MPSFNFSQKFDNMLTEAKYAARVGDWDRAKNILMDAHVMVINEKALQVKAAA